MVFIASESIIPAVAASALVALIYGIFKSFNKSKDNSSNLDKNTPKTFQKPLHITDKISFLERIDYWMDEGNYKEAKHLCKMFKNHNGPDKEIKKRLKKIKLYY